MLVDRGLILAKIESTYGVDPTPAAATDAILALKDSIQVRIDTQLLTRNHLRESLSRLSAVVGRKLVEVTFQTEIKGSGAAGTPPRHGVLHRMCSQSETIVVSTSVTYVPINTGHESGTIYVYFDGILHKVTGCYGNQRVIERNGEFGVYEWRFLGLWNLPVDAGIASGAVFDTTKPVTIKSLALTLGGYTPVATALELDMGIQIGERPDFNSADGLKGVDVGAREAGGSIDPEAVVEATHPFWQNFQDATEVALGGNTIGSVAGNKVQITGPKLQYEPATWGSRGRRRTYNVPFRMNPTDDSASDEISFVYT